MKYRIDQGDRTCMALGICDCGDRFAAVNRAAALRRLGEHERIRHPDDTNVRSKLGTPTHRNTRKR